MSLRMLVAMLIFAQFASSNAQGQAKTESVGLAVEFPVVFQSRIIAGKTPSGTKIHAKLAIATLVNGTVVPRDAKFSGEVIVSQAKTGSEPSRLGVRMDAVSWKGGSIPIHAFLTEWFYASLTEIFGQSAQAGPVLWNDTISPAPAAPKAARPPHREKMMDVDVERGSDGTVTLVCKRHAVKIDRSTTYVLRPRDMASSGK